VAAGLVDETRRLRDRHGPGLKVLGALGYKEALAHLDGQLKQEDLTDAIRRSTRRFARRQRMWFARYNPDARLLHDAGELPLDEIENFWKK
jgi:tRNA dimethylallyltransferase